jgi:hypothetical protein
MPRYIVERTFPDGFEIPTDDDGVQVSLNIVGANTQEHVTWIHSYISIDRKKSFCVYEGPSPEAVRLAASQNNLPIDRITEVRILDPYFYF